MRLLVVMRYSPFPPKVGSAIVAYNVMKILSKSHAIRFIALTSKEQLDEIPSFIDHAEFVYLRKASHYVALVKKAFYALVGVPPSVSNHIEKKMTMRVREITSSTDFDAILLFEMEAIQYCPSACYDKIIVNIEDPQSIKLFRMANLPVWSFWEKIKMVILGKIMGAYEKRILPQMRKVLLLSEADRHDMQKKYKFKNLEVMSYGVNAEPIENIFSYKERTRGMIVFSGNMFHPPNVDGILYFLRKIFPLVLKAHPMAKLWIVGAEPDRRIRDVAANFQEHVVITGRVSNMAEYLRAAMVSICPVRLKIGVQTKILEALSWGTPVVTTSAGNSGIGGAHGCQLWVEDEPDKFAYRVVNLLEGKDWNLLSAEGRKLVEKQFSWRNSAMQLSSHIELMAKRNQ